MQGMRDADAQGAEVNELAYVKYERHKRLSKKGPTARYRAKRKRADDAHRLGIRAACVLRDGYCKFVILGGCKGLSQHAHLGEKKRARTRGMQPEERHTLEGSVMACAFHHREEEAGRLTLSMFPDLGAQGPMVVRWRGVRVEING